MENKDKREIEEITKAIDEILNDDVKTLGSEMPPENNLVQDNIKKLEINEGETSRLDDDMVSNIIENEITNLDENINNEVNFYPQYNPEDKINNSLDDNQNLDNEEIEFEEYESRTLEPVDNILEEVPIDYSYENQKDEVGNSYDYNNVETQAKNKRYLDYNIRLIIPIVAIVLFLGLFLIFLTSSISINKKSNVTYKQTSNLDYKVFLKENEYYKEPYLNKNMQYIASLIDNIDANFNYDFKVNQEINYKYTYYINSEVKVTDPNDKTKVIYSKIDKLTEPKTVVMEKSNGFSISEDIKIDYGKYNDLIKGFKSSYVISADSNLELSLCVAIEDEKGNKIKSENSPDNMKLTIPLTEQVVNIKMDYKEINNSDNVKVYKEFNIANKLIFALSMLSLIGAVVFIVKLIIFIKKTSVKKNEYDVELSKILREYDRVIVNSRKDIELKGDIIEVNSFGELLDVRDNLEKPIIFKEIHKGQKSIFVVKNGNETYRYVLKLVDLQKNKDK